MELSVAGKKQKITVSDDVFDRGFSEPLVHQVVTSYLATGRSGTKAQKNRSAVSGGGRKPYKQKGTGNARAGTIRSPIWVGGGRAFAAQPRDFTKKVNTKMYRAALKSILSEMNRQDRLVVVDDIKIKDGKTKEAIQWLGKLGVTTGCIINDAPSEELLRSVGNLPNVFVSSVHGLDPVSLVASDKLVATVDAIKKIEEWLA